MRKHLLLTVLGTNPHAACYSLGDREVEAPLAPVALFELLPHTKRPDLVLALCTSQAKQESWPLLERALGDRCRVEVVDVADGDTQPGVDDYLTRVTDAVPQDVDLTVDVTHGYRHFSFLTYAAVLYLAALRGIRVRDAYYGLLRPPTRPTSRDEPPNESRPRPDGPNPFLDLRPLLELPRWLHALETLRETGSTVPLASLLRAGPPDQSAQKVSGGLSRLSEAYLSGLPLELGHQADLLLRQQSLKPLKRLLQRDHNLPLAGELVGRIKDMVEPFALTTPTSGSGWKRQVALSETELKRQAEIIDDLLHHGNIATTLGLLNEWTVSWVVWRRGREREWLDYQNVRRGAGNFLDAIAAVGRDPDLRNVLTDEQRTLGVFWSNLRELRNAYAHHGMRPQDIVGNQKAKQLEHIRSFWATTLRGCPDLSLALGESPGGRVLVSPIGRRPGVLFSALETCRTDGRTGDPVMCVVICSHETEGFIAEAARRADYTGAVEPLRLVDPYGGRPEIERLKKMARRHFIGADEVLVNVTGGTTLMGLAAEALATAARRLACPVRRFGLIDRRPPAQQDTEPYRPGEPFWIDSPDDGDAHRD